MICTNNANHVPEFVRIWGRHKSVKNQSLFTKALQLDPLQVLCKPKLPQPRISNQMEPRVNGAKMSAFIGRSVRLPCRVLKVRYSEKNQSQIFPKRYNYLSSWKYYLDAPSKKN